MCKQKKDILAEKEGAWAVLGGGDSAHWKCPTEKNWLSGTWPRGILFWQESGTAWWFSSRKRDHVRICDDRWVTKMMSTWCSYSLSHRIKSVTPLPWLLGIVEDALTMFWDKEVKNAQTLTSVCCRPHRAIGATFPATYSWFCSTGGRQTVLGPSNNATLIPKRIFKSQRVAQFMPTQCLAYRKQWRNLPLVNSFILSTWLGKQTFVEWMTEWMNK